MRSTKSKSLGRTLMTGLLLSASVLTSVQAMAAEAYMPECYRPATAETPMLTTEKRDGPYRIALVNGFFGIPWRSQMIQSAKAWASRPENAADIKEFKVVSVGTDAAAQIAAVDNFIQAGYDAVIVIAVNPSSFGAVAKRAAQAGTVIVSFDNVTDDPSIVGVTPSQFDLEASKAQGVVDLMAEKKGKVVLVRGVAGNAADRDRHAGAMSVLAKYPDIEPIEVIGNWDQGQAQKLVSDLIATQGELAGVVVQHGAAGAVNALLAAGHKPIPVGGDGENSFRLALVKNNIPGASAESSPGQSAIAMQAAIAMLKGYAIPAMVHEPISAVKSADFKEGVDYFPNLSPSYNTVTGYEACKVTFTPEELGAQSSENQ